MIGALALSLAAPTLAARLHSSARLAKSNGVPAPLLNSVRDTERATELFVLTGLGSVNSYAERRLGEALQPSTGQSAFGVS
ncbi:MAG: hypothetical protein Q3999_03020 [Buchananella hordeovulneris]|nr:hypothetical protein [Buchananella hordeovulneris]